ncbi:hypothetical protein BAU15_14725 [Enterococcus sp. JM4C]|uniref:hypothetical protein n=1 Tax=Candidatus Enterococcus huntleyi TaxID=1857217 RepID=UPI00137AA85E|nr:hypothetical protein [Enterococcus sp. JM4C]KAF1296593.1 hypothetical protein BAU15_14725 [Enterococcus sp. JM4C]
MPDKDFDKKLADIAKETKHGKKFEELDEVEKELNLDHPENDDVPEEAKDKETISELIPPIPPKNGGSNFPPS